MMNKQQLPPDDLPAEFTVYDEVLRRRLNESATKGFYESCDRITRALLSQTEWNLSTKPPIIRLVINCPSIEVYWYIISAITQIANRLDRLCDGKAIICVFPPKEYGAPFEMRVSEIFLYKDFFL
ncbi:MAG: hypothetical protein KME64_38700 [Scytonematopsis contorta HA4267-MV1]|jgi:hypothetical protein|nr:hypothetical protein [Scytonematopsis contorta HA4267-MV1]